MKQKKVNWNDKESLEGIVKKSSSYNEVLKNIGLKTVSSNTRTLKKYLEKYNISTSHFDYAKDKHDPTNFVVKEGNEPWFKMEGRIRNPSEGVRIELDWSEEFISFLKQVGFKGATDEEIFGRWLNDIYKPLGSRMSTD